MNNGSSFIDCVKTTVGVFKQLLRKRKFNYTRTFTIGYDSDRTPEELKALVKKPIAWLIVEYTNGTTERFSSTHQIENQ
jgi:hypothetical protein